MSGMSPGMARDYYDDDPISGNEDEEEFAFHWAGGDAGDVQAPGRGTFGAAVFEGRARLTGTRVSSETDEAGK